MVEIDALPKFSEELPGFGALHDAERVGFHQPPEWVARVFASHAGEHLAQFEKGAPVEVALEAGAADRPQEGRMG